MLVLKLQQNQNLVFVYVEEKCKKKGSIDRETHRVEKSYPEKNRQREKGEEEKL